MKKRVGSHLYLAGLAVLFVSIGAGWALAASGVGAGAEAVAGEAGASPVTWPIGLGAGMAIGLSALATGFAQARIGAAGMGALAENPKLAGTVILCIAIPETMVILGFVVAYLLTSA